MWPFAKAPGAPAPRIVPATQSDLRVIELEARVRDLERCVVMLAEAIKNVVTVDNTNFEALRKSIVDLASYTLRPKQFIMGEHKESN